MSSSDDAAWPLPKTWAWTTAGQIAQVIGGGTPDTKDSENFGGFIPWITPADMSTHVGKTIAGGSRFLTEKGLSGSGARWLPEGTVLFSSRAPIGYTAVASRQVTTNQGFKSFVPESCITSDYLYHWLASSKERAEKLASGTTFLELSGAKASLMPVPLAPVAEQVRVVEKLEELLSDLDAGVAELKAAQRKLAQYRQSLLKAAVDGTLTADWRAAHGAPQETGAKLLQRILTERRARWEQKQLAKYAEKGKTPPNNWQAKYPEPVVPTLTDLPPLPAGWAWATVDQLASVGTGVTPLRSNRAYFENGEVPWTTSGALNEEVITAPSEHVTNLAVSECRLDLYPIGTLLVAMYGEGKTRGKCAELAFPSTINQAIAAIVFQGYATAVAPHVKTFFLDAYEAMRKQASGGVQPNLNLQIIKALCIPLPPLSEQVEVQVRLDEQLASYRRLKDSASAAIAQSVAQRKNLLKAAFAGQLVPQDPNDEPASALLARIRAKHCEEVRERPSTSRARKAR